MEVNLSNLLLVTVFSLIGGVFSLIGGLLLFADYTRALRLIKYVTPFAAGALLAAAFLDLLPEAIESGSAELALQMTLLGIVAFFLLERFLRWFHHHHANERFKSDATAPLIILGDTIHNFIDGIAIAAAFLIDVPTGIVTTFVVAAHEIPQEFGDFGLLLQKGLGHKQIIKINIFSALATTFAAVIFYQFGQVATIPLDIILGLVAGFFIYIAVSDIIPGIHKQEGQRLAGSQTLMLVIGAAVVAYVSTSLHSLL